MLRTYVAIRPREVIRAVQIDGTIATLQALCAARDSDDNSTFSVLVCSDTLWLIRDEDDVQLPIHQGQWVVLTHKGGDNDVWEVDVMDDVTFRNNYREQPLGD